MSASNEPTLYMAYSILSKCVDLGLINRDSNDRSNILVYRTADSESGFKEGWYSQNIWDAAEELFQDAQGMDFLLEQIHETDPEFVPERMPEFFLM